MLKILSKMDVCGELSCKDITCEEKSQTYTNMNGEGVRSLDGIRVWKTAGPCM